MNNISDESWTQKKTAKPGENHLILNLKNGSLTKFKVAADTCIGRSEFSEVIEAEDSLSDEDGTTSSDRESECSAKEINRKHVQPINQTKNVEAHRPTSFQSKPPVKKENNKKSVLEPPTDLAVEMVTQSTAEIGWKSCRVGNQGYTYRIQYWPSEQGASLANEISIPANESSCRLEQLLPETTYSVNILACLRWWPGNECAQR